MQTQQRVRLDPAAGVGQRIVAFIKRADIAERRVVDDLPEVSRIGHRIGIARRHANAVLVFLPGD